MYAHFLREVSVVWSLIHALILFLLLFRSRYSMRKTILLSACLMLPLIVFNIVIIFMQDVPEIDRLFVLTCALPGLLGFYLISEDRTSRFLFTFCLTNTCVYWVVLVTSLLDHLLGNSQAVLLLVLRMAVFPLAEWFVYRRLRKPYLELQEDVTKGWGLFAVMSVFYYMLMYVQSNFPVPVIERRLDIPAHILILILMPCTYITFFVSLYRQLLLYRQQQNDRILQEQKQQLEARLENQLRIRKLRHNMKGNVLTLSGLLAAGRVEEAQAFLKTIGDCIDASGNHFCANPYLDAVFSHYYKKYKEIGVPLQMDIQVGDEAMPSEDLLCQILANGLENAFDALNELPADKRAASVQMRYKKDYLLIRIKNRCSNLLHVEKGVLPHTTKGGMDHGLGLVTVQEYAKRMGGELLCYTEDGYFLMDVMVKSRI